VGQGSEIWFQFHQETHTIRSTTPVFKGETAMAIRITHAIEDDEEPLEGLLQGCVNPQANEPESGGYPMISPGWTRACDPCWYVCGRGQCA